MANEKEKVFETVTAVTGFNGKPQSIELTRDKGKPTEKNYKVEFAGFDVEALSNEKVAEWAFEKLNSALAQSILGKFTAGNAIDNIESIIEKLAGGGGINSPVMQYLRIVATFYKESYKAYNKAEFFSAITPMAIKSAILGYSSVDFTIKTRNKATGEIKEVACTLARIIEDLHRQKPELKEIYDSIVAGVNDEEEEVIFDI